MSKAQEKSKTQSTDLGSTEKFTTFVTNDAQWHFTRRQQVLKKDPQLKKYFRPWNYSLLFLVGIIFVRLYCMSIAAQYIWQLETFFQKWLGCLAYTYIIDQIFMHSGATFSHEHSHNLIFDDPFGILVVDFFLDFHMTSFGAVLEYVYTHSRFHHPNLGDPRTDSELQEGIGAPRPGLEKWISFTPILCPGIILISTILDGLRANPEFFVPEELWKRTYTCNFGSLCGAVFIYMNAGWTGVILQLWALSFYVSPLHIWLKGQDIAEHLTQQDVPTYSTYRPVPNLLFFNTGYHDEHHTFPLIPWVHLPTLQARHKNVFCHEQKTSYFGLYWQWALKGFFQNYRDLDCVKDTAQWMDKPYKEMNKKMS